MISKENKTLSPKLDVVFQALFGEIGAERITKGFLEKILKVKLESIDLDKNPILRKEFRDEKLGVLDIIAELNNKESCNIEMQLVKRDNLIERILFYWSRLYCKAIKSGESYSLLKKTIVILIADFEIEGLRDQKCHTKWSIIEENERLKVLTDKFELHIIQLPKKGNLHEDEELLDWLNFLDEPKAERVIEKMKKNKELKEAGEKLDKLSADERMQRIAELREKAIMDEKAIYSQGVKDGVKDGFENGMKQGIKQNSEFVVKKMREKNFDIQTIMDVTGLTEDEIIECENL